MNISDLDCPQYVCFDSEAFQKELLGTSVLSADSLEETEKGLLSLVNTGFTNPGNPSDPSLFSALFLAIPISLSFFSTSGAHFRVSTGGHVPEVPE
ncbi:hypothetical protein TNCV_3202301 [Trichonephila clavipes]|nr:hypothetical protein TNCV_3202301 [Trichonephila clavipes]